MERYTIEDIELIRRKSGISYQEAVALLDYHNGNVARALVDLERNGRIKPEGDRPPERHAHTKGGLSRVIGRLFQCRLKVRRGETVIVNVSLLFGLAALLISPHLLLLGLVLCLIQGYRFNVTRRDPDFAAVDLERMVKDAAQNVRASVGDIARGFGDMLHEDAPAAPPQEGGEAQRSYYRSAPSGAASAPVDYAGRAPVLQVPVQVESQDGKVTYTQEPDGYGSATIE